MTKRHWKVMAAAAAVAATAACSDLTGSRRLPLVFQTDQALATGPFAAESNLPGTMDVYGAFGVAGCVTDQHAEAHLKGSTVTLRVQLATNAGTACPAAVFRMGYVGRIGGLGGKLYHLRVEHYGTVDSDSTHAVLPDGLRFKQDVLVH